MIIINCPPDTPGVLVDLAHYLHAQGVVRDPMTDQAGTSPLPSIWVGGLHPTPDHAVSVIGPWQNTTDSDTNPLIRFMVVVRSTPDDLAQVIDTSQKVHTALHREQPFDLTARQSVMFCERVISDPPMQDENRRWRRVTTYEARLHLPTPH